MGSGKLSTKAQITMAEEKKSVINTCKNAFKWFKKGKGNKETKCDKHINTCEENVVIQPPKVTPVAVLLEKQIEKRKEKELEKEEEDELKNFSYKIIEDEPRGFSIDSQSSVDSGFTEKTEKEPNDRETEELTDKLKDLKVDEGKDGKKKKLQTVVITRAPIKSWNESLHVRSHPYSQKQDDHGFRQTDDLRQVQSQINKQTLSGGNVIVNDSKADNLLLAQAVNVVDQQVESFSKTTKDEQELLLSVANEFLNEVNYTESIDSYLTNPLSLIMRDEFDPLAAFSPEKTPVSHQSSLDYAYYNYNYDATLSQLNSVPDEFQLDKSFIFPTPPRSENVPSPMSDSYFPTNCDLSLSPGTSSPMRNGDLEVYQSLGDFVEEEDTSKADKRKEKTSNTLKYYKDLQKEISNDFSKKECCQINRRSCKEIFQEHIQKLKKEDRLNICLKVAKLDAKQAFGVLCYLIIELAGTSSNEDLQLAIFGLICEKVLAQTPAVFVDDFGLDLIKLAALRCHTRPLLTRYLVQCARVALRTAGRGPGDTAHIFKELDAQGDNLLHACVRKGDACALVLSELVRKGADDVPLFNVHHNNSDGYTPLHLACSAHSPAAPRLHLTHALLAHGAADLWRWDVKGGDTAVHLAVNSASCELHLIMVLFRHVERKQWKRLAHARNRSSVTPLDYARSAARSSSRPHYPQEVLEFLQKCR